MADTFRAPGGGVVATVIEDAGAFHVLARCGRVEARLAAVEDRAQARRLARSAAALGDLAAFREWIASGSAGETRAAW